MTLTEDGRQLRPLLMRIRYDATAIQAKITDAFALLDELGIDEPPARASFVNGPVLADTCSECNVGGGQHAADCGFARAQESDQEAPE